MGAVFGNEIYHIETPDFLESENIATLEMFNILVAIRVWAKKWQHKSIKIHCDNSAVVAVLNNGKTRDKMLATIARNIFMAAAQWDIDLDICHVAGKLNNIADLLSRWQNTVSQRTQLESWIPAPLWCDIHNENILLDYEI